MESLKVYYLQMATRLSNRLSLSTEEWLGEYQGHKVAITMTKDLKGSRGLKANQQLLVEASIMTYAVIVI